MIIKRPVTRNIANGGESNNSSSIACFELVFRQRGTHYENRHFPYCQLYAQF